MKHLTKTYDEPLYSSNLLDFYFKDMRAGVLDIETTGLSPARSSFILGGLFDMQDRTLHQYFADNRNEEEQTLKNFCRKLSGLDMVVTYNGKHFDMPFINKRLGRFSAGSCRPYNLDLYLVLNGHSPVRNFISDLKQKTVERYMGLRSDRTDEISGAESVELYSRYERCGDPDLCRRILLHNSDDVLQLSRLLKIVSKTDFHKAMYHLGFPAGPLIVEKIRIASAELRVTGRLRASGTDFRAFSLNGTSAGLTIDSDSSEFTMTFPILRSKGLAIADLEAAGLDTGEFSIYPEYGSGFLVLQNHDRINHMEVNHLIKALISSFTER